MKPIELLRRELSNLEEDTKSLESNFKSLSDIGRKQFRDNKAMIRLYKHSIRRLKKS